MRDLSRTRFTGLDLTGATICESVLDGVRVVACEIDGLRVSGHEGRTPRVYVNDVEVSGYVEAELDRRHPERVTVREAASAAELLAAWDLVGGLWDATIAQARELPAAALEAQVDGEFSFVETLRHLVCGVDVWVGRMLRDDPHPFHLWGWPPALEPGLDPADLGLDVTARPSLGDVLAVLDDRRAQVRTALAALDDAGLAVVVRRTPGPWWGELTVTVERCVRVVLHEWSTHRHFAVRDLAVLGSRAGE